MIPTHFGTSNAKKKLYCLKREDVQAVTKGGYFLFLMHSHLSNLSLLPIGIEPKQKAQFDRNTIRHTQLDID